MHSDATTVEAYLAALPHDRRAALEVVRQTVLDHLPEGLVETMAWGMISYVVPLEAFADTYNGEPLVHTALANQKQHMSLYLNAIYADEQVREDFEEAYRATGKRYDVGKSCVRFRRVEDLPLEVVAAAISATSVDELISQHERALAARRRPPRKRVP